MDLFEAIERRTSVRHYTGEALPKQVLQNLADAGRRAPSGRNVQPLEFIIFTDQEKKEQIAAIADYGKFLPQAPACIAVYSKDTKYYLEDGCAAVQNILLAATALGLGSCWIAGDKKPYTPQIDQILKVPTGYKLVALVAVGYPAGQVEPTSKKPLEQIIHWEQF